MRKIAHSPSTLRLALTSSLVFVAVAALVGSSASAQLLAVAPSEPASGPHIFAGHTPHMVTEGQAAFVEHYDSSKTLRLTLSLNLPHPVEEAQFLEDLQNKQSPLFHQYLTPEQWDARFAPSAEDEQAVVDWATSQGLTVTARYPDRLLVDVEGSAGNIERALNVTLNTYTLPSKDVGIPGEVGFSNDRDPILPSHLNTVVLSVMGLNSFEHVHPASSADGPKAPDYTPGLPEARAESAIADAVLQPAGTSAATDTSGGPIAQNSPSEQIGYYPTNLWSVGGYDTGALMRQGHCCNPDNNPNNSPEQTSIAIAAYGDLSFSDVAGFHQGFPYLAYNVEKINIDGGYTCQPTTAKNGPDDNCLEVTLDTEWSLAMANSQNSSSTTAKIYVYEAGNYFGDVADVYNHMASDNYARVSSTSWGCQEIACWDTGDMSTVDGILAKMAGQGWTQMAASGDQGSTGGCSNILSVQFPSSDPNIIGVGGTTLRMYYDSMQFISEVDWIGGQTQDAPNAPGSCNTNNGGSTGGFSAYFTGSKVPGYQSGMGFSARAVPDVALNANYSQNLYFQGNWGGVGGTSMSSPMVAGFFAQANAYLLSLGNVCNGKSCGTFGNANYNIYELARNHDAAHVPFYDTISGCSSNDKTTEYHLTAYCAKPGFDETTGWGSFNMLQMAWALNFRTATANGFPDTVWSGPATNKWYNTNQNISWKIDDYIGQAPGSTPTGIAGFNQGWDSIPNDSTTQPHGDASNPLSTDTFFTGPQFVNGTTGCLALASGEGCSGGVSQGCHTAHVRGWNNMGMSTGDTTYGPVCYDTVAPTVTLSTNPYIFNGVWTQASVGMTLAASDSGGTAASGIAHTYYGLDNTTCQVGYQGNCSVYNGAVNITTQGKHTFTYFTMDNAGNSSPLASFGVWIDETAPTTTIGLSGTLAGGHWTSAVSVTLKATDNTGGAGVKHTTYSVDGAVYQLYTAPFSVSTPGSHSITFESDDLAGNAEAPQTDTFVIESPVATALSVIPSTTAGNSVTLKATLSPTLGGTPPGTITFYNNNTKLSTVALSGLSVSLAYTLPAGTNVLYAAYTSSSNYFLASNSPAVTEITTTTTLTSNLNPATYGQYPGFVAVVKAAAGASPSGTVTFYDGTTVLATETLASDGDAILLNYPLAVGTHKISAIYNGSSVDFTSTSSTVSQVINILPTTTTLKSSLNPANFGSTSTFSATIGTSSFVIATGSVAFKDGTTILATVPLNGSNGVSFATSTLTPGAHSITAVYSGSTNESASTSAALSQTVAVNQTTTTLTTDLNPAPFGSTVLLNATVKAVTGAAPTGTIAFKDGTTTLATLSINAAGVATYAPSNLTVGTHSITATYTGDTGDATSTSAVISQKITAATTTTTVTSSLNPSTFGKSVTFLATVAAGSGSAPTGTVTFKDGATVLGTETLASAKASFTTSTLIAGTHSITAVYTADTDDATSTSAVLAQVITAANTTTSLATTLASASFGLPVTFTTSVKAATGTVPTGTVTFKDGTTTLATETLAATGSVSFTTATLAVGTHSISVVYKGTASDATSTSATVTETITADATTTTLVSSLNPATHGTAVKFTATVKSQDGPMPAGAVTFKDGTAVLGTANLVSGIATFSTSSLTSATHSITASYAASTVDAASTSAVLTETIH
jgi:hypothetical protein